MKGICCMYESCRVDFELPLLSNDSLYNIISYLCVCVVGPFMLLSEILVLVYSIKKLHFW